MVHKNFLPEDSTAAGAKNGPLLFDEFYHAIKFNENVTKLLANGNALFDDACQLLLDGMVEPADGYMAEPVDGYMAEPAEGCSAENENCSIENVPFGG
jgi:hypothetical protein